ncbi:MAG: two-component regulator propeller domain-containing protein [Saprospiraceae bacterium]
MKKVIVIGLLVMSFQLVFGQAGNWENYAKPEIIHDHVETTNDIWFSTNAGVVQIDKNTLEKTYHNRATANIPSNIVEGIAKDSNGNIWIGTYNQAIAKFDGTTWTNYDFSSLVMNAISTVETYCIEIDNQDKVWVGTNEGLLGFDGTNWEKYDEQNVDIMFDDIWALGLDNQGNLFAATNNVFKFDGTTFTNTSANTGLILYGDADLLTDANGDVWVNNSFSAIGKYDGTSWTEYTTTSGQLPQASFYTIGNTPNGDVYFTSSNGKYVLDNGTWTQNNLDSSIPLDNNNLSTYFYDNQGVEWAANGDILYQKDGSTVTEIVFDGRIFDENEFKAVDSDNGIKYFITEKSAYTFDGTTWNELSLPSSLGNSYELIDIEVVDANNIWVAADQEGVMNWNGSTWTTYNTGNSNIVSDYIEDITFDATTQTLWVVNTNQGLSKFDGTTWTLYNSSNTPMADNDLRIVTLDNNGDVYTTTAVSAGNMEVWHFDGTTWTDLVNDTNAPQDAVTTIHIDNQNVLWAGVGDNLVYKYVDNTWTSWNLATEGLAGYRVYDIAADDLGNIYVATYNGAASFDGTTWSVWTTETSGIGNNRTYDLEVESNNVWFATEHGISLFEMNTTNTTSIISKNKNINVYPNPIVNNAMVEFTTAASTNKMMLRIISVDGRTIQEILITENRPQGEQQLEIQRGNLVNGIYYLQIQTDTEQFLKTILIQD